MADAALTMSTAAREASGTKPKKRLSGRNIMLYGTL